MVRESKYRVLAAWLQLQTDSEVEIAVEELERRLRKFDEKFSFPKSAYKYQAWWANEKSKKSAHTEARNGWLAAGWKAYPRIKDGKVVKVLFGRG